MKRRTKRESRDALVLPLQQREVGVPERAADAWKKQNRPALAAYDRFVAEHGIWNEDERGW